MSDWFCGTGERGESAMLAWKTIPQKKLVLIEFTLTDGLIEPNQLSQLTLPPEVHGMEGRGLVISGRGPVWLFAHLAHLAHPFAWVATFDPRLEGAVVVQRHRKDAPEIGKIIKLSESGSD